MTTLSPETIAKLVERLHECLKLKYLGDCNCSPPCQLVPADLLHEVIGALTALSASPSAEMVGEPVAHVECRGDCDDGPCPWLPKCRSAALPQATAPVEVVGWHDGIDSAPHASTVLATYFDREVGEWVMKVFDAERPVHPFTHWSVIRSPDYTPAATPSGTIRHYDADFREYVEALNQWFAERHDGKKTTNSEAVMWREAHVRLCIADSFYRVATAPVEVTEDTVERALDVVEAALTGINHAVMTLRLPESGAEKRAWQSLLEAQRDLSGLLAEHTANSMHRAEAALRAKP